MKRRALERVAQLPVAVVGGDHRAGAQPRLQRVAALAGDDLGRALQRQLDLGDRRDRDLRRQDVVQHMVVAQIGVGQHIVADGLGGPQAAAVADHQPGLGAQHRQVVGDGLGVGGADADVDQADAAAGPRRSGGRPASGAGARRLGGDALRDRACRG